MLDFSFHHLIILWWHVHFGSLFHWEAKNTPQYTLQLFIILGFHLFCAKKYESFTAFSIILLLSFTVDLGVHKSCIFLLIFFPSRYYILGNEYTIQVCCVVENRRTHYQCNVIIHIIHPVVNGIYFHFDGDKGAMDS